MKKINRFLNRDKIKVVNSILSGESPEKYARELNITRSQINKWVLQHQAGLFSGREHMTSIPFKKDFSLPAPKISASAPQWEPPRLPARVSVEKFEITEKDWKLLRKKVNTLEAVVQMAFSQRT